MERRAKGQRERGGTEAEELDEVLVLLHLINSKDRVEELLELLATAKEGEASLERKGRKKGREYRAWT